MIPARVLDKAAKAEWQRGVPEFSLLSRAGACSGKMRTGKAFVAFLILVNPKIIPILPTFGESPILILVGERF